MKSNGGKSPVKPATIILVIIAAAFFISALVTDILRKAGYFNIKDIMVCQGEAPASLNCSAVGQNNWQELAYLKGRNIFSVDFKKEINRILRLYPAYKRIRFTRVLPDRLFIEFIKRTPLGIVKSYRYFYVDEDMVIFDMPQSYLRGDWPLPQDAGALKEFPVILGLNAKISRPNPGNRYNIRELALALNIIKEMSRSRILKNYRMTAVNVANPVDVMCIMPGGLQVRLNDDNIKGKIDILGKLLLQVKKDLGNVEYVDLRFKDPVIRFKVVGTKKR